MCGIIGYIGKQNALPILMEGLKKMEYRGYDSAGIAVCENKSVFCEKAVGKIGALEEKLLNAGESKGTLGIGHCLHPETVVQLSDGSTAYIKDLFDGQQAVNLDTDRIKVQRGEIKVSHHVAPKHLYRVQTPLSSFLATGEHDTLVYSGGAFITKQVKDLKPKDLLPLPRVLHINTTKSLNFQLGYFKRYYRFTPTGYLFFKNKLRSFSRAAVATASGVSHSYVEHIAVNDRNFREDQLQLLYKNFGEDFETIKTIHLEPVNTIHGKFIHLPTESSPHLMQILGYFFGDGYAGEKSLRFKDMNRETLGVYQRLIADEFNLTCRIGNMSDTSAALLECNSFYLCEWLKENIKADTHAFIASIGQLPLDQLAAFIRGLFDAEGYLGLQARQLGITTINSFLMRSLQLWLLRFGIISSLLILKPDSQYNRPNFSYKLSISNKDSLLKFKDEIDFGSKAKSDKLKRIIDKVGNKRFSFRILNESAEIILARVTSIEKVKSDTDFVYDLEINGHHNFLANSIFTHNSRWATHGGVTEENAHPHSDCKGEIWLVHNGIIENHRELKNELLQKGHRFKSETDTEVIAHLIEELGIRNQELGFEECVRLALQKIRGTYGLCIMYAKEPQKLIAARNFSPLLLGVGKGEYFVASDASALLAYTKRIIYLDDGEISVLTPEGYTVYDLGKNAREKASEEIEWSLEQAQKGGHPHFMIKEIFEEPEAIENSLRGRLLKESGTARLGGLRDVEGILKNAKRILISACGTAAFAARIGEYMLEEYARIPVKADVSSEFRYRNPVFQKGDVFLAVSQSGETADTLGAQRVAKKAGLPTLGIINVVASTIARETDAGVYQHAGPEIGVASTKAFTSQVAILALFTLFLGRARGMSEDIGKEIARDLARAPEYMRAVLAKNDEIRQMAQKYQYAENFFFLGRKYSFPVACEGALKLKEVSYAHAEGYGAGEMKHGPIAMIHEKFPSICIVPKDSVYEKTLSNIQELKARKGPIIAIATEGDAEIGELADDVIYVPKICEPLSPLLTVLPTQLFAYHFGVLRGYDVDKPRNLAKSVVVE